MTFLLPWLLAVFKSPASWAALAGAALLGFIGFQQLELSRAKATQVKLQATLTDTQARLSQAVKSLADSEKARSAETATAGQSYTAQAAACVNRVQVAENNTQAITRLINAQPAQPAPSGASVALRGIIPIASVLAATAPAADPASGPHSLSPRGDEPAPSGAQPKL